MSDLEEALEAAGANNPGKDLDAALKATRFDNSKRFLAHHMAMREEQTVRNSYAWFDTLDEAKAKAQSVIETEEPDVSVRQQITDTQKGTRIIRSDTSPEWR